MAAIKPYTKLKAVHHKDGSVFFIPESIVNQFYQSLKDDKFVRLPTGEILNTYEVSKVIDHKLDEIEAYILAQEPDIRLRMQALIAEKADKPNYLHPKDVDHLLRWYNTKYGSKDQPSNS